MAQFDPNDVRIDDYEPPASTTRKKKRVGVGPGDEGFDPNDVQIDGGGVEAEDKGDGKRHPWQSGWEGAGNRLLTATPYFLEKFASDKGIGNLTPEEDADYRRRLAQSEAKQQGLLPGGPKPWQEFGKDPLGVLTENFAVSAPETGAALLAGLGGAAAGTAIEPGGGTVVGGGLGLAAGFGANLPSQIGSDVERATDSGKTSLTTEQANRTAITAPFQAAAEEVGDLALPFVGKTILKPFKKAAIEGATEVVEKSGLIPGAWKAVKATGKAAAGEIVTEPAQTAGERYVAGQPLTNEEARREYRDAAITAGLVGGATGAALHPVDLMTTPKKDTFDPEQQTGQDVEIDDETRRMPPPARRAEGREQSNGVDELLDYGIRTVETGSRPDQVSEAGAKGAFQLLPSTAKRMANRLGIRFDEERLLNDVDYNRTLAREYMRVLIDRYDGDSFLATTAYHAGEGNVDKWVKRFGYDPANKDAWLDEIEKAGNPRSAAYPRKVLAAMGQGEFGNVDPGASELPGSLEDLDFSPDTLLAQVQEMLGNLDAPAKVGPDSRKMVLGLSGAMQDADPDAAQAAISDEKDAIETKMAQLIKQQEKLDGEVLYDAARTKRQARLNSENDKLTLRSKAVDVAAGLANRYGDVLEKVTAPPVTSAPTDLLSGEVAPVSVPAAPAAPAAAPNPLAAALPDKVPDIPQVDADSLLADTTERMGARDTAAGGMQQQSAVQQGAIANARAAILKDVLSDKLTHSPGDRFIARLRRAGLDTKLTPEEQQATSTYGMVQASRGVTPQAVAEQTQAEPVAEPPAETQDTTLGVPTKPTKEQEVRIRADDAAGRLGSSQREWFNQGVAEAMGEAHDKPTGKDTSTWFKMGRDFVARERGLQNVRAGRAERTERRAARASGRTTAIEAGKARQARKAEEAKKLPPGPAKPTREQGIAAGLKAKGEARTARKVARKASAARKAAVPPIVKKTRAKAPEKAARAAPAVAAPKTKAAAKPASAPAQTTLDKIRAAKEKMETAALKEREAFLDEVDKWVGKPDGITAIQAQQLNIATDAQTNLGKETVDTFSMAELRDMLATARNERAQALGGKFSKVTKTEPFKSFQQLREWDKRLRAEMAKRGLANMTLITTSLEALEEKYGVKAQGHFEDAVDQINRTIEVAFNAKNPLAVLSHEIIHALRAMGVITEAEWDKLATLAQSDRDLMQWISEAYPELTVEEQLEEAVAEKFADWSVRHSEQAGLSYLQRLMTRIKDWFAGMKVSMQKTGFKSAEEVMHAIDRGVIARRYEGKPGTKGRSAFMMSGEQSAKASKGRLKVAKALTQLGVSEDIIWQKTGWLKDVDGKWKYEIDDSHAVMMKGWEDVDGNTTLKLGDVLIHPDLYEAYPQLRDMPVTRRPMIWDFFGSYQGWFDGTTVNITPYATDPMSTLIHEVQHAVQAIEGFATGGNSAQFNIADPKNLARLRQYYERRLAEEQAAPVTPETVKEAKGWLHKMDLTDTVEGHAAVLNHAFKRIKELQADQREAEQDMVALRKKHDADYAKAHDDRNAKLAEIKKTYDDAEAKAKADKATRLAETKKVYDDIQQEMRAFIDKGGRYSSPEYEALRTKSSAAHKVHLDAIVMHASRDWEGERKAREAAPYPKRDYAEEAKQVDAIRDRAKALRAAQEAIEKDLANVVKPFQPLAYDLYTLLSGEVESRDTEARRLMSADQRRATIPGYSENIRGHDRIVTFTVGEGGAAQSFTIPPEEVRVDAIKDPPTVKSAYSKVRPPVTPQQRAKRTALDTAATKIQAAIDDRGKKGLLHMVGTKDIAKLGAKYMPSIADVIELHSLNHALGQEFNERLLDIKDQHLSLPKDLKGTTKGSINDYIYDSTRTGKWGYQPSYHDADKVTLDPDLERRFKAIAKRSPKAANVIKAMFRLNHDLLRNLYSVVSKAVDAEFDPQIAEAADEKEKAKLEKAKGKAMKEFSRAFDTQEGLPYASLSREGDWIVVGKSDAYEAAEKADDQDALDAMRDDGNHLFVDFRDTAAEAAVLAKDVAFKFGAKNTDHFERASEAAERAFQTDNMHLAFKRMQNAIASEADKGSLAAKQMHRLATDLYLHSLTSQSVRKTELGRENVSARNPRTGEVPNMMKNFVSRGSAMINYISSLANNPAMQKALNAIKEEAHAHKGEDHRNASRMHNVVMYRYTKNLSKQPNRTVDKISAGISIWTLLTLPGYYITNALQTAVTTQPILASKFGYPQAGLALTRGYQDFMKMTRDTGLLSRVDFKKAPADVRAALDYLLKHGHLDAGFSGEFSHWEMNGNGLLPTSWNKVDRFLRNFPKRVEVMNRTTAGIAAYRLAVAKGMKPDAAMKYAGEIIDDTHGDYSGFNSPSPFHWGQGEFGKIALQFRKFQHIMGRLLVREVNRTFRGATFAEKAQGGLALAYLSAHMLAVGGVRALPAVSLIGIAASAVMNGLDDDDDKDWKDWKQELRDALGAGKGGEDHSWWADFLYKGAPYALGADMSERLGLANAFALAPYSGVEEAATSREKFNETSGKVLTGATGGVIGKGINGWGFGVDRSGMDRLWQGLEGMSPSGLAAVSKAVRFKTQGVTTKRGDTLFSPDDISLGEAITVGLGVTPRRLADQMEQASETYEATDFHAKRLTFLKDRYNRAVETDNEALVKEVRKDFEAEQKARLRDGFPRQSPSVLTKAPKEKAKREEAVFEGLPTTKANREFVRRQRRRVEAEELEAVD